MNTIKISFDLGVNLHIKLDENKFVDKWCSLLAEELATKEILQIDTFSFFIQEDEAKHYLIEAINTVNDFLKTTFINIPTEENFADPEYYNHLHKKFEQLAGSDWNKPTRLMSIAPHKVRLAVRHINRFCHRLEQRPYKVEPMLRVELDSDRRELLSPEDYELFVPIVENNRVYLDYSTLGKSLHECYEDDLDPTYAGLKMQEHYCANFVLKFGLTAQRKPIGEFKNWLKSYDIDLDTIKNHGHIPLGYIVEENLLQSIVNCRKINKITLEKI
jgi:hypothetical protein